MEQSKRREYLIRYLLNEDEQYISIAVPQTEAEQRRLLRALINVRPAKPIGSDFLKIQDEYLSEAARERGVVTIADTQDFGGGLYLWQGNITRLAADAIVNAANSGMTGCYVPNHTCIDNCIHTYSGLPVRSSCNTRDMGNPPGRQRSLQPIICRADMCCTPLGQSFTAQSAKTTQNCLPPVTVHA